MKDDKKVIVKRNDLYQKAWSKPMTKLAAEGGNARGMNSLGVMYQKGYAIFQVTQKVEPKESLEIFKKGKDKVRRKLGFGGNINAVPYLSLKLSRNALK